MKKSTLSIATVLTAFTLVACNNASQQNPLTAVEPDTAARFLVEASAQAERAISHQSPAPGGLYRACLTGKAKSGQCEQLYPAMLVVATQTPAFNTLSMADLTDTITWETLQEDYGRIHFNRLPD